MKQHAPSQSESGGACPLRTACLHYYFKPMAAFFNAFHLRAYQHADLEREAPILDAGCYDGTFGGMLAEVLGTPRHMTGLELSESAIRKAGPAAQAAYREIVSGSATQMPFPEQSFRTVLFNAALSSLFGDAGAALREAHRVLEPDGTLIITVCTHRYEDHYWRTRLWRFLRCNALAEGHIRDMNRRMQQFHVFTAQGWEHLLQENGFEVIDHYGFLPLPLCTLWSVLAWTPWRVIGILRLLPLPALHRAVSALYLRAFRGIYDRAPPRLPPAESGFVLIKSRKASPSPPGPSGNEP